jgi:ribosomal protein L7/L12
MTCGLTLLKAFSLANALRDHLTVDQMPPLAILTGDAKQLHGGGVGPDAIGEEAKAKEKEAFNVKLEGFDAAAKLNIIKELRTFTNLGKNVHVCLVELPLPPDNVSESDSVGIKSLEEVNQAKKFFKLLIFSSALGALSNMPILF